MTMTDIMIMISNDNDNDDYLMPALQHDIVESRRTALRLLHPEPMFYLVKYLKYIIHYNIAM